MSDPDRKRFSEHQPGEGVIPPGYNSPLNVETISTGNRVLDRIFGDGIPRSRITEIYGNESCGKTALALANVAETQREGGLAAFIDVSLPWQLEP